MFGELVQIRVSLVFPLHVFGELEFRAEAGPVLQHSRFVGGHDHSKFGIQADLGQRRGVHLLKDVERLAASPAVVDKNLAGGFFRAGRRGNGISGIVDPLALPWVEAATKNEMDEPLNSTPRNLQYHHHGNATNCCELCARLQCHPNCNVSQKVPNIRGSGHFQSRTKNCISAICLVDSPQLEHVDHVKVDNVKDLHGLVLADRT